MACAVPSHGFSAEVAELRFAQQPWLTNLASFIIPSPSISSAVSFLNLNVACVLTMYGTSSESVGSERV
jgi:hypothetical protein